MSACPQCGSPAEPGKVYCTVCGGPLASPAPAPSPVANKPQLHGTMIGLSPLAAPPAPAPAPAPVPAPAPAPAKHFDGKGTMLGMPAMPVAPPPEAPAAAPSLPSAKRTMLGVAIPGIAPLQAGTASPAPVPAPTPPAPTPPVPAPLASAKQTMLGVALPGIAPLHAGAPPPTAWSPPPVPAPSPAPAPEPAPWSPVAPRREPRAAKPAHAKSPALIALAAGGVLALGAIAFALLWKNPPPLTAQPREDAGGKDVLHLTCASCADGTQAKIDGVTATFARGEVDVPLAKALGVGENRLVVALDRPGSGRDETVPLVVPVAYRVRPDLTALDTSPPSIRVVVEAQPGASVAIDGKAVALGADGRAVVALDVSAECAGTSDDAKTIERSIPYAITPRGGAKGEGKVGLRVGVAPLHLDAPGSKPIVEGGSLLVAGRTSRGGAVTVGGKSAQVGADGAFTFTATVPQGGSDLDIRASASGMAPRTARVHVERVASLAAFARDLAAKTPLAYADLAADPAKHAGEPFLAAGEVVESRAANHQTIVLVDTQPCAKSVCLVRVVRPGDVTLARGAFVRAYGQVTREFKGPPPVPELEASFLVQGR